LLGDGPNAGWTLLWFEQLASSLAPPLTLEPLNEEPAPSNGTRIMPPQVQRRNARVTFGWYRGSNGDWDDLPAQVAIGD
jgi:hypothetical protein